MGTWWLFIKALLVVVPWLVERLRDHNAKEATLAEIKEILDAEYAARLAAAIAARDNAGPDGLPDPNDRHTWVK